MLQNTFTKQSILLTGYILLMSSLLYIRDIVGIDINKLFFVTLVFITSICCEYKTLVSVITFTLPLMCGLPGNYFLPIWVFLLFYKLYREQEYFSIHVLIFIFIIFVAEVAHYAFYPYNVNPFNLIGYISSLALVSLFASTDNEMDYSIPIITFCIGCCVLLFSIFMIYTKDPMMMYSDGGVRMGGDSYKEDGVMTLATNANNVGYLSSSCFACVMSLFYYKKIKLLPFLLIVGIAVYCGMFSVSRTWILTIALILLLYFIMNKEDRIYGYILLIIFFVGVAWYVQVHPDYLNMYVDRFTGDNIETGGDRTINFSKYNHFLDEHFVNLLFGTGALIYKEVTGLFQSTHNGLQQIWLSYGIVGFIGIMFSFIKMIIKNYIQGEYMSLMPMISIVFFLQTIQVLNPYNGLFPLIAAFFVMKMVKQDKSTILFEFN